LPRGHIFPKATFTATRERVDAYLRAVGDTTRYGNAVPPLAAVALGLLALQEHVSLPDGALHTGQEVEQCAVIPIDEPLTMEVRVAQRSERQGMVVTVIEYDVVARQGLAVRARTTIIAPGAAA